MNKKILTWLLEYDLLPCKLKWKTTSKGMGYIIKELTDKLEKEYGKKSIDILKDVFYSIGYSQAERIRNELKLGTSMEDVALAVLAVDRIWGMKTKLENTNSGIVTKTYNCPWSKIKGWGPKYCAVLDFYEMGLVEGINPNIKHFYTKRRSLGHEYCEGVFEQKK